MWASCLCVVFVGNFVNIDALPFGILSISSQIFSHENMSCWRRTLPPGNYRKASTPHLHTGWQNFFNLPSSTQVLRVAIYLNLRKIKAPQQVHSTARCNWLICRAFVCILLSSFLCLHSECKQNYEWVYNEMYGAGGGNCN